MNKGIIVVAACLLLLVTACGSSEAFSKKTLYIGRFSVAVPEHWRVTGSSSGSFQDVVPIKQIARDLGTFSEDELQTLVSNEWSFLLARTAGSKIRYQDDISSRTSIPARSICFRKEYLTRRGGKFRVAELDTVCAVFATPQGLLGLRTREIAGVNPTGFANKLESVARVYRFGAPSQPSSDYFVTRNGYYDMPPKKVPKTLDISRFPNFDESIFFSLHGGIEPGGSKRAVSCSVETKVVPSPKPRHKKTNVVRILKSIRDRERVTNGMRGWEEVFIAQERGGREENPPSTIFSLRWIFAGKGFSAQEPYVHISFETKRTDSVDEILAIWDAVVDSFHPSSPFKE